MKVLAAILYLTAAVIAVAQNDLTKAKDAFNSGQYETAIQSLQQFLAANSRNVEAQTLLAEAYRLKGELPKAQEAIERALDLDDEYEPALASSIRIFGKLNLWDNAQKSYNLAAKYHKTGILAPLAYAQAYLDADSVDKASIYFSKLKELDARNVDAYVGLAEVYARQNIIVMAVENLRTATKINPNDPTLWYKLATAILKNRSLNSDQIKEIIDALQKSIDLDPTNVKASYDAGNIFYRIKYWLQAAEFFKKYTDKVKDNAEAWEKFGISAYNAKATLDAIPALEQAIKMNPKNYELKPMLGHSYFLAKEFKKAIDLYNSLPKDSLTVDDLYRMGFSDFQLKDTINAIRYFERTIALDSGHTDAIGTLAAIYLNKKDYENAVKLYNLYLKKEADNITALFYHGFGCFVLGRFDSAKASFKRLVELRPNNMQARQYLGQIYSIQDSTEQGRFHANILVSLADSAIKADPKKAAQNSQLAISGYRLLALFDYKDKNIKASIDNLEKAVSYEKGKKDEGLHLFLAQMYAVYSGDTTLLAKDAKEIRANACKEYQVVLKINPKNAAAKKESAQMNCGK